MGDVVAAGVDRIQLREKDLDAEPLFELAVTIGELARAANPDVQLLINRRVDVALAAGWNGVHLGFDGMAVSQARALLPPGAIVTVASHRPGEFDAAPTHERPDELHLAPIWSPLSKASTAPPLGCEAIAAASGPLPIIAQGGVTAERAGDCIRAGAAGIAVTGEILSASDPARAAHALRLALDAAKDGA